MLGHNPKLKELYDAVPKKIINDTETLDSNSVEYPAFEKEFYRCLKLDIEKVVRIMNEFISTKKN